MSRVSHVPSTELPLEIAATYQKYASGYGPFRNQVAIFAHVPPALQHIICRQARRRIQIAVTQNAQRIRDALFERLRGHLSDAQIVELTLRIALCGFSTVSTTPADRRRAGPCEPRCDRHVMTRA